LISLSLFNFSLFDDVVQVPDVKEYISNLVGEVKQLEKKVKKGD